MPPREPSAVRPPACKLLGFPALSSDNSWTQLIALSTAYPWYSLNSALQSAAPHKITKTDKTKHRYDYFTSVSSLLKCPYTLRCTHVHWPMPKPFAPYSSQMSPENAHKLIILGVNTLYMLSCFLKQFALVGKGLIHASSSVRLVLEHCVLSACNELFVVWSKEFALCQTFDLWIVLSTTWLARLPNSLKNTGSWTNWCNCVFSSTNSS